MPVKQAEVGIKSPFDLSPLDLTGAARKAIENCANAQIELLEDVQTTTREWFDRVQAETDVASEFVSKLRDARSFPDAITACRAWTDRHFAMMTEDTKHLLDNTHKFVKIGARTFSAFSK